MGYIGSQPATNFETVRKQVSTTNSGTTITLDYSVSSVQDILVTVNAVVQSYDNYSVSGTTLTLGGTLNNDRVEILYVGRTFQTVSPAVGTVTNEMLSGSIANSKLANSSISINGSSVSLGGSTTIATGGTSDVLFAATMTANQTLSHEVLTKVSFNDEIYDVGTCYDPTTNYRFTVPSNKQGYYHIGYSLIIENSANSIQYIGMMRVKKNGTEITLGSGSYTNQPAFYQNHTSNGVRNVHMTKSFIINLNASDYIEMFAQSATSNSSNSTGRADNSMFWGYKLIT